MADGTVLMRSTAGGLPLGIDPDADYPTTRLVLEPGETMLVCTDGLIETGGHDLDTGWRRIRGTLESHDGDMEALADALVQAVHGPSSHHTTGPLADRREDDIAVLLLSREAERGFGGAAPAVRPTVRRTMLTVAQAEPERIADARRQLRELLHDWASADQLDSAVLLVSEMLTNVLVHTDADALLVAEVTGEPGKRRLRVAVTDGSDDLPHRRDPGELASSGRGLVLMEMLADAWGVDPRGEGKSIWFEFSEEPSPASGADEASRDAAMMEALEMFGDAADADGVAGPGGPGRRREGAGRAARRARRSGLLRGPRYTGCPRRLRPVERAEFVHDPEDGGRQRHGEQHAEDAGDGRARGDGQQHHRRMHLHRPALDHRLEDVSLQDLHGEHDPERPQRDDEAPVRERDQHRHRSGDEGAEVGEEGADEDERPEPHRARDPQDQQPDRDAHGVDERDQGRAAHEPLDGAEGAPGHRLDHVGRSAGRQRAQGPRHPVRVAQEEEDEEQGEDGHGEGLADDADPADDVGGGRAAELGQQVLGVGGEVVERGARPRRSARRRTAAAWRSESTIWSPVWMSAPTTM